MNIKVDNSQFNLIAQLFKYIFFLLMPHHPLETNLHFISKRGIV
jgi:hypothetical protein